MDRRYEEVDRRLDGVDARIDGLEKRMVAAPAGRRESVLTTSLLTGLEIPLSRVFG